MQPHECVLEAERINKLILERLKDDPAMAGREGCYWCVSWHGVPVLGGLAGKVPALDRRQKYNYLSREKVRRVYENYNRRGHRLSRQSADESREKYPGAIKGDRMEYGVSGYPADVDEIFSTLLAFSNDDISGQDARALIADNPYLPRFLDLFPL